MGHDVILVAVTLGRSITLVPIVGRPLPHVGLIVNCTVDHLRLTTVPAVKSSPSRRRARLRARIIS
jgi:hypothetical protein